MNEFQQFRLDRGLTKDEAAHLFGVHPRTWEKWEYDERTPSATAIKLLAIHKKLNIKA